MALHGGIGEDDDGTVPNHAAYPISLPRILLYPLFGSDHVKRARWLPIGKGKKKKERKKEAVGYRNENILDGHHEKLPCITHITH